jgi:hypothetical protein
MAIKDKMPNYSVGALQTIMLYASSPIVASLDYPWF